MHLTNLRDLYTHDGPFITVHLEVGRPGEDGRQQLDTRCTNLRHDLEHAGVGADLVDDIESRIRTPHDRPGPVRRTIVAASGAVVLDETRVGATDAPEVTTVGPLPDLAGWLDQAAEEVPWLLVLADHEGADLELRVDTRQPADARTEVHGDDLHLHQVQLGGPAHPQYQRRSENVWRINAREVADEIRSACRRHAPDVVVLAGDVRARTEIAGALEHLEVPVDQVESGARTEGASEEALWSAVDDVLTRLAQESDEALLDELGTAGAHGRAAHGLDDVLDALVRGEVDRLVLDLAAVRPMQVDPARFPGLALPDGARRTVDPLPADQVLLAAATATDARVHLVPGTPADSDGVSALLRWAHDTDGA
ncbi:Vms1/Ankzf1 family peptidyl-tRNA hydrolase [Aeromicrobium marinum]|uniref:baeRF2 domain-containing protein n=1 Tax=Aeromicrobium marinum TaxID=219314 RepID=UPI00058C707E|nr:Vms1/Ankzf1 family peptidyl-tRNA hydrolase [Aeromicrobium marinum]